MRYDVQLFYSYTTSVIADSEEQAIRKAKEEVSGYDDFLDYDTASAWEVDENGYRRGY